MSLLSLALPKGSLQQSTFALMAKAGYNVAVSERSYYPRVDDPDLSLVLLRPQEIPRYVERGSYDAGITGSDWVAESGCRVETLCRLAYGKSGNQGVRWVLAVPRDAAVRGAEDLRGRTVATELVAVTRAWLQSRGVEARVEFSWGATEVKPPRLADAIVELTETGSSLEANGLREVETVLESATVIIASAGVLAEPAKRLKLENFALLMQGAVQALSRVGLKLNVTRENLAAVLALLPALRQPTVSPLAGERWVAVETVLDESVVRTLVPALKRAGAEGLIEYPLNKVIL